MTQLDDRSVRHSMTPHLKNTLYWHPAGLMILYLDGYIHIEDLNPEITTKFMMSRKELFWLGWRCIKVALRK